MSVTRRSVLKGLAGVPLAAVLADARLARAAAAGLETVRIPTAGGKNVLAALAMPARTPAPAILLVHEWWGLNDQIKSVAADLAAQGYIGLAIDLYDGQVTDQAAEARRLAQAVGSQPEAATETLVAWIDWLRKQTAGSGRLATVGWCFGGGWSLNASIAAPVDATVIYYGDVRKSARQLERLDGPVLGHFATRDRWINRPMVEAFAAEMAKADKRLTVYWYDADHAFANPTGARYDAADTALAWRRTLNFFAAHLT